ncbi:MAG TPA: PilZ domain-containing protein [Sphingomicrobium sp.]|nr:PilZ domain-containing protein [Sphingomicrobium sp.]
MLNARRAESLDPGRPPERRRNVRQLALLRVALLHAGGVSDICVVRNVSSSGLSARVYRKLLPGEQVEIEFRSGDLVAGSVVWEHECDVGIVFPKPIDVAAVLSSSRASKATKRRALPRIDVECKGRLSTGLQSMVATLRDISQGGASLEVEGTIANLTNVQLILPDLQPIAGVVRWTSGRNVGVSFNECIAFEQLARWIQAHREGLRMPKS